MITIYIPTLYDDNDIQIHVYSLDETFPFPCFAKNPKAKSAASLPIPALAW